jgi:glycosyltransferase involved in cell wall biosynthesis
MSEPRVCAVMLTADRPEMARRAVECFRAQTYRAKRLLIFDSGSDDEAFEEDDQVTWVTAIAHNATGNRKSVGELRNEAAAFWTEYPLLIHWDDDDWSHPNRIAEQVALLQSSGADAVGYNEMLFWRGAIGPHEIDPMQRSTPALPGEAWLYRNANRHYTLGTSLCYWRKTWEVRPFPAANIGEDWQFLTGRKVCGLSSLTEMGSIAGCDPRMIARIHAGNTSNGYDPREMRKGDPWRRVPEWDEYARSVME